jgi:hypothetical protein
VIVLFSFLPPAVCHSINEYLYRKRQEWIKEIEDMTMAELKQEARIKLGGRVAVSGRKHNVVDRFKNETTVDIFSPWSMSHLEEGEEEVHVASDYEQVREGNIQRNNEFLKSLGLLNTASSSTGASVPPGL